MQSSTGAERQPRSGGPSHSLLWWVSLANAGALLVAFLLLVFTPIEIDAPPTLSQLLLLAGGLMVVLALNLALLRWVLGPLVQFTALMRAIDPDRPGRRLDDTSLRSREGKGMAEAFNSMLERLEHSRHEASRTALAAQEGERRRVARELHDEVGQSLTAAMIRAEHSLETGTNDSREDLRDVVQTLRTSLDDVRRIAQELRPESLDDLGLINSLIALCSRIDENGSMAVRRELAVRLPPLSQDIELVIYRVAQEGLTNALRHAEARQATLSLAVVGDQVALTVSDDGVGLPTPMPAATVGISGMRERALLIDGRLEIDSRPEGGTELRLIVPAAGR